MEKIDFLPLGSVVIVKGGVKKMLIIARGLAVNLNGDTKVFDYGGCLYPEGLIGDRVMYFNHTEISKVVFNGFSDDDNTIMTENINEWMEKTPYERGNAYEINTKSSEEKKKEVNSQ
jgi:hypothetical protein